MFKEQYKNELEQLTVSPDFKEQTLLLMQRRREEQPRKKTIAFPLKRLALTACVIIFAAVALANSLKNSINMAYDAKSAEIENRAAPEAAEDGEFAAKNRENLTHNAGSAGGYSAVPSEEKKEAYTAENGIDYRYMYTIFSEDGENYIQILANRQDISYNEAMRFYRKNVNDSREMFVLQVG